MLEVDTVLRGEVDLGHGDQLALNLAGACREAELGHIAQSRRLAPPGIAYFVPDVKRRATRHTRGGSWLILCLTPPALDCFHGTKHSSSGQASAAGRPLVVYDRYRFCYALFSREFIAVPDDRKGQI